MLRLRFNVSDIMPRYVSFEKGFFKYRHGTTELVIPHDKRWYLMLLDANSTQSLHIISRGGLSARRQLLFSWVRCCIRSVRTWLLSLRRTTPVVATVCLLLCAAPSSTYNATRKHWFYELLSLKFRIRSARTRKISRSQLSAIKSGQTEIQNLIYSILFQNRDSDIFFKCAILAECVQSWWALGQRS